MEKIVPMETLPSLPSFIILKKHFLWDSEINPGQTVPMPIINPMNKKIND